MKIEDIETKYNLGDKVYIEGEEFTVTSIGLNCKSEVLYSFDYGKWTRKESQVFKTKEESERNPRLLTPVFASLNRILCNCTRISRKEIMETESVDFEDMVKKVNDDTFYRAVVAFREAGEDLPLWVEKEIEILSKKQ